MFARFNIHSQILGRAGSLSRWNGLSTLAVALGVAACLSACGQRGPLFLPPPPKASADGQPVPKPVNPSSASIASDLPTPPPAAPSTSFPR
ncbi:LPS translocon maturation chaperone LptM [Polaromonas sp.]|uniref:LPS translocon maturation chaperone LptM n=1 Tax=Polaromonas sp. TaxID=1869339 RepID=UPI0039C8E445